MGRSAKKENRWKDIDGGSAFIIPVTLLRHDNFRRLSPWGHKLIMDLGRQYTGFNNGYLCAAWTLMKEVGWKSEATLYQALRECEHYGLLRRTQQGGRNRPNLYALTWRRIDDKPGNPIDAAPTMESPNDWKEERPLYVRTSGKRRVGKRKKPHLRIV